jgi:glycosyltransferase involved in cell wall biosynthesis
MRALHLTSGNMYGGVETFLATLARESESAPEMHSEFAVCFEGRLSGELTVLGRTPHVLGHVRLSRPHTLVRARRALTDLLRRESFDVVVCHQPWPCVVFGPVVRRAGFPLVLWVHMAGEGRHWLERLARRTRPDLAICNSHFSASRLSRWLSSAQVEQVYYPVSFPESPSTRTERATVRRALQTPDDDVVIVQVSRLEAWKGQRVLITALSHLRDLPGWTCWIVGGAQRATEAVYLRELQALASDGGIADRVRFVGERRDVPTLLSAADVFCQPNTSPEPFGLALVEALHAGLPVVTSGIGGACEIVDGSCGVLTPPGDASALSIALQQLIVDRDLNARLGAAARRRPDALCDASRQMRRIHEVLSSVAVA